MCMMTIEVPENKAIEISYLVEKNGGKIITRSSAKNNKHSEKEEELEVTHEKFFGENIRRALKALKKNDHSSI
jgi:hypothetical protein